MGNDAEMIGKKIIRISQEEGWKRLLLMVEMLCMMSEAREFELLSSRSFTEASKSVISFTFCNSLIFAVSVLSIIIFLFFVIHRILLLSYYTE